ncbi:MAG: DUF4342 domain-containing protein [Patescibacteria group bacterium]|jgi:hypothetical protein
MEDKREEFKIDADQLVKKVKEIIAAGNARTIIIKNEQGVEVMTLPLTVGVVGTLLAAPLVAVGAIAALMTKCTIIVVKK